MNATLAEPLDPDLSTMRWGEEEEHDDAPISIPADRWDWHVAGWPHDWWAYWRARSAAILAADPRGPRCAEAIREAGHLAYCQIIDEEGPRMPQERSAGDAGWILARRP